MSSLAPVRFADAPSTLGIALDIWTSSFRRVTEQSSAIVRLPLVLFLQEIDLLRVELLVVFAQFLLGNVFQCRRCTFLSLFSLSFTFISLRRHRLVVRVLQSEMRKSMDSTERSSANHSVSIANRKRWLLHNERWKVLNGTVQMDAVASCSMIEMEMEIRKDRLLDDTAVDSELTTEVNACSSQ